MIKLFFIFYVIPGLLSIFCILRHDFTKKIVDSFTFTKLLVSIIPGINLIVSFYEILSWFIGYEKASDFFMKEFNE